MIDIVAVLTGVLVGVLVSLPTYLILMAASKRGGQGKRRDRPALPPPPTEERRGVAAVWVVEDRRLTAGEEPSRPALPYFVEYTNGTGRHEQDNL